MGEKVPIQSHSEEKILEGCIALLREMAGKFQDILDYYDVDTMGDDPVITMNYFHIVQRLFLFSTDHGGGTSTREKCKELGIDDYGKSIVFNLVGRGG